MSESSESEPKWNSKTGSSIALYKTLYLMRAAEEAIRVRYPDDGMKTPMHMSMGSEAIAAGVCMALGRHGQAFSSYRSHAVYLAKTGETDKFFAELYGKATGAAGGKAGSMHLSAPERGFWGASAVVATPIPVALGAAFAHKSAGNKRTVAVFFGDGAVDEGVFWETLNAACALKIPLLFVCEDNGLAIHSPKKIRHGYSSLAAVAAQFRCHVAAADTTDVEAIYRLAARALARSRRTLQPSLLHLTYYRYLEHVGVNEDFESGYRSRSEFARWARRDPVTLQRKRLLREGIAESRIRGWEKVIDRRIGRSIRLAEAAPHPPISELSTNVAVQA